ncbi:hypothetical protein KCU89_g147, partial [Aureobasidium melanogenum]
MRHYNLFHVKSVRTVDVTRYEPSAFVIIFPKMALCVPAIWRFSICMINKSLLSTIFCEITVHPIANLLFWLHS